MTAKRLGTVALIVVAAFALVALPAWLSAQPADAGSAPSAGEQLEPPARGYLGVSVRDLTPELRRHFGIAEDAGLLVASVLAGGPAEAAGVEVGDVLVAVDGDEVASSIALRRAVRRRPGEIVDIDLYRDGSPLRLAVSLGERSAAGLAAGDWPHDARGWQQWAERWQRWGEEMGETWGRFGAEMGEKWGRRGEEMGEIWGRRGEEMGEIGAELGLEMGELGAEIGLEVARAMAEIDWDEISASIDESMRSVEAVDWEEISRQVERSLEQAGRQLERSLERMERELERAEKERDESD